MPAKTASDWRGQMLETVRRLMKAADPQITEAVKWRKPGNPAGVPVWEKDGLICTRETYKDKVKLTFAKGAARWLIRPGCSMPSSTAMCAAPSICARAIA